MKYLLIMALGTAVFLLGTALAPVTAAAGEDEAGQADVITTELHPGWNMVGWLGPETPVSDLFNALPAIEEVQVWDSATQRYQRASRASLTGLPTLTPGLGLWLYAGGDRPVSWERPVAAESFVLTLEQGSNLVAWARQGSMVGDTLTRLGEPLVFAARWNAEQQRFDLHIPDAPDSFNTLTALAPGEAIWVEMSGEAYWWVPGTRRPRFEFTPDFTAEEQEALRREFDTARAVFAERFGVHTTDFTVSARIIRSRTQHRCHADYKFTTVTRGAGCIVHEYFHILQHDLAQGGVLGPPWMVEGFATYAEAVYDESLNHEGDDSTSYDRARRFSVAEAVKVPSLENPPEGIENPNEAYRAWAYHLGFLAAEWLVNHAGRDALIDYYKRLPASPSWERAFEGAFGISVDDFYARFEAHRVVVAPPLPHLTDDVVAPVVAFLGNIPKETQATIEAEIDSVTTFFADQLGVEPFEYTMYVAEDSDAARATFERLRLQSPVEGDCSTHFLGSVAMHTCPHALSYHTTIFGQIAGMLRDKVVDNHPLWLRTDFGYLAARYRRANGLTTAEGLDFDSELLQHAQIAKQSSVPLQRIENVEGWVATSSSEAAALTFLALDWLARRAGEGSLVNHYRLLPRGSISGDWRAPTAGSWQAAFEQAFGLTIEDFYRAFADYRSGLP